MSDIIKLLPDSVANQIAAGEVIQRPASVIKELVENAVDAKSTEIKVNIIDAGKTLIQVIDNGIGMSETDARMAFERHATSKINKADDLFNIQTKGFRGEALASIAAIAHVELRTKQKEKDVGTLLSIKGSEVIEQEVISCSHGSNFSVKNLFYNVPARRKFLKTNTTELKHIFSEFQRIVLAHPEIKFSLYVNNSETYNLPISNVKQRIVNLFKKSISTNLIPVDTDASFIKIKGYIGKPDQAKKSTDEQFFFVNNRYMRHPYFHKAIMMAYENILPPDTYPSYFIYFEISPDEIDINIHPSKIEIKFADAPNIFQILRVSVKEALGKFNIVPTIDFNMEGSFEIPVITKNTEITKPKIDVNASYNPFDEEKKSVSFHKNKLEQDNLNNWEDLYSNFESQSSETKSDTNQTITIQSKSNTSSSKFLFHYKNKYIFTPVKSGIMLIHTRRAHERILFERFLNSAEQDFGAIQKMLYPQTIELSENDTVIFHEIIDDVCKMGFEIRHFGKNTFILSGLPANIEINDFNVFINDILNEYKSTSVEVKEKFREKLAATLAKSSSFDNNKCLTHIEMQDIIDKLFACSIPNFTFVGKKIISIITFDEIEKRFNK